MGVAALELVSVGLADIEQEAVAVGSIDGVEAGVVNRTFIVLAIDDAAILVVEEVDGVVVGIAVGEFAVGVNGIDADAVLRSSRQLQCLRTADQCLTDGTHVEFEAHAVLGVGIVGFISLDDDGGVAWLGRWVVGDMSLHIGALEAHGIGPLLIVGVVVVPCMVEVFRGSAKRNEPEVGGIGGHLELQ